ncbi:hypothetical protein [Methylomagnum sp.]
MREIGTEWLFRLMQEPGHCISAAHCFCIEFGVNE